MLSNICVCGCKCLHSRVFLPISRPFPPRTHPPTQDHIFVSCKCNSREAWLPLPLLPLRQPPSHPTEDLQPAQPGWERHIQWMTSTPRHLLSSGGDITILMRHSTPGVMKKKKPGWHPPQTPPSALFHCCPLSSTPHFLVFFLLCHICHVFLLLLGVFFVCFFGPCPLIPFLHTFWFDVCKRAGRLYALELKRPSGEEGNRDGCIGGESKNERPSFSFNLMCGQNPGW